MLRTETENKFFINSITCLSAQPDYNRFKPVLLAGQISYWEWVLKHNMHKDLEMLGLKLNKIIFTHLEVVDRGNVKI